jgi:hypothetical protein
MTCEHYWFKHVSGKLRLARTRPEEYMRGDYEVPGINLLQAYLYIYSLQRGVTFQVLPLSSCALSPTMLPLLETFWNSCCGIAFSVITFFFWLSSVSQNFRPFKADFIFRNKSLSELNEGNRVGVLFHYSIFGSETA